MKKLYEILVPTIRNDGRAIRTRFHRIWDKKVREVSGGLTIYAPAKGQWISPSGETFAERMIPVRIFCTPSDMEAIAKMTLVYYEQEAVMYYRVSDECYIVRNDE